MESIDITDYLILSILLILWCVLHSAMISISVTEYFKKLLGSDYRFYRVFFNLIAILTLLPVAIFAYSVQTQAIFEWNGYKRIGQVLILGLAVWFFLRGGRHYDIRQVIGIKQIKEGSADIAITAAGDLDTSGVLEMTRHPWYLATMLLIWGRQMDVAAMIVNVILTAYLIVGTYLEEKKLVREFGEKYRNYQKKVSMLLPYRWLKEKVIG
ncbi:MAG: isoprenylcysteine carboxylmethyltransferase family protein [Deltaproteobacteria bacterium]|jgi:protein-S-isoprenylcysteine O-methyltransferase Ste14|nr:isoprenylcysteine carboxylmethyltransferase family protein [Deltaproteobacteria bacterium]